MRSLPFDPRYATRRVTPTESLLAAAPTPPVASLPGPFDAVQSVPSSECLTLMRLPLVMYASMNVSRARTSGADVPEPGPQLGLHAEEMMSPNASPASDVPPHRS